MNVAKVGTPGGGVVYLDIDVVNTSTYAPYNVSQNGFYGRFAQVSFAVDTAVSLRAYVRPSCARADSCSLCDDETLEPTSAARRACYASGCGCFGYIVTTPEECEGISREARRDAYGCPQMDVDTAFPPGSLVGFSVYDLNTGPDGECAESLTIDGYDYVKTPLRPSSGNTVYTTVRIDDDGRTFTGTVPGLPGDKPSDPNSLSDSQAISGVQFFFSSSNGYIEATFATACGSGASQLGAEILFAGQSSLCAPPPPLPPQSPPAGPPPSLPPPSSPPPSPSSPPAPTAGLD